MTPGHPSTEPRATSGSRHIAVLFHEGDRHRDPSDYVVDHLAEFWREDGHRVSYVFGVKRFVPADIVLVHVNLSVVPGAYLEFASRYPIVLNGKIADIRKSTFSRNVVRPGDPWDGPVIIKSDLNYAGVPERFMQLTGMEHRWRWLRRVRETVAPLLAAVAGLVYALPVIVLFLLGQRYLLNIYSGGIKG